MVTSSIPIKLSSLHEGSTVLYRCLEDQHIDRYTRVLFQINDISNFNFKTGYLLFQADCTLDRLVLMTYPVAGSKMVTSWELTATSAVKRN